MSQTVSLFLYFVSGQCYHKSKGSDFVGEIWDGILGAIFVLVYLWYRENFGRKRKAKREKESTITDEDLLTYSLLTGNKEMEKAVLWKIWSK